MRLRLSNNSNNIILFAVGLLSQTQVNAVGWIGISELFCFAMGPIFFFTDINDLRRNGFLPFFYMIFLCFLSGMVSNYVNHIPFFIALKGLSASYAIFSISATLYHYLRRDLGGVKWLLVGIAISTTACQFVFQPGSMRVAGGEVLSTADATDRCVGYSLFWISQFKNWLCLPIRAWYLETPTVYSVASALFVAVFGFVSSNNRSSMVGLIPVVLIFLGRKKVRTMTFLHRYFWLAVAIGIAFLPLASATYKYTARQGLLGEGAQRKYEDQTKRGTDMKSIFISGRTEFFAGLFAVLEKPIVGHGSWAIDTDGYYELFLAKYGDADDWKKYNDFTQKGYVRVIPAHSWVVGFWLWNGIGGLILMLYVLWLMIDCLKNRLHIIPEWYGYFVLSIPAMLWSWLFSPFGGRVSVSLLFIMCLFARAVSSGRYRNYRPPVKTLR